MKKILRSRLPQRFADRVPPLFVEIAVALLISGLMALLRIALVPWAGERAAYAPVFVAVVGATVIAGWRSGLLAIIIGQWLAWTLVVAPASSAMPRAQLISDFSLATFSQLVAVVIIWLYEREVDRALALQQVQLNLLDRAIREINHRTANNYQTVLSLVLAQARRAKEAPVKEALQQVADRIAAISAVSNKMAIRSGSPEEIEIDEHLRGLCAQIEQGLFRPGVRLECDFEPLSLRSDHAIALSILVNELVTNALKHAFPGDGEGVIGVSLRRTGEDFELIVADDGVGIGRGARGRGSGLGNRLIELFTAHLSGKHGVETGISGTRHRILFPLEP